LCLGQRHAEAQMRFGQVRPLLGDSAIFGDGLRLLPAKVEVALLL
jgi:hypothetical protein